MRRYWIGLLLVISALIMSGCSDFVDHDQPRLDEDSTLALEPNQPVGQTFVARHGGLKGLEIWLTPGEESQGTIRLHLRSEPDADRDLASATLSADKVTDAGFYRLSFPALRGSHGHYYYAFLEVTGERSARIGRGPGDAYLDGGLYRNHEPLDAQMTFRLVYAPALVALELVGAAVRGVGLLAMTGLLYIVPGWALLELLWHQPLSWAEKLSLSAGLSLALYPVLLLWTDLIGLHLGSLYAWVPLLVGTTTLIWRYRRWRPRESWESLRKWLRSEVFWPQATFLILMTIVFAVRLLVVRTLDAPLWGDSYQHTTIAQLLVDNGGLFDSWQPYAPLQSLTYHFGFHSAMAALHWLTGMAMHRAVLWGAQVLNGLAILALYPLGVRGSGNRWGGSVAVLVAGLLSLMPMTYVNWGRYTQLAGQVILPTAVLISWRALEASDRDWQLIALGWLAVGGLALTHYRVLIFYMVFVLAWIILSLGRTMWRQTLIQVMRVGTGAVVLFLPWFIHIFGGRILRNFQRQLATPPSQTSSFMQRYNAIGGLTRYMGPALWLLLAAAVVVGLWRRKREVLLVVVWWFLLFIATNPRLLHLPGTGAISNFALFIAIYIPAGILIGYAGSDILSRFRTGKLTGSLTSLLLVGIGLGGMFARIRDVDPASHAMVTRPDIRAMAWIRENTPEDARFLVNSFYAYGGSLVVGSDGGWWLPLLADRANTVPPLNYGTEQEPHPGYREWVKEVTTAVQQMGVDEPAMLKMMRDRGITHVYIGQQQGRVNYGGPHILDADALRHSEHYRLIYHRDRVWVFEVSS